MSKLTSNLVGKTKFDQRIAVLGCGSIGRRHIGNLLELGYKNLLAFDPSPYAVRYVDREYAVFSSAEEQDIWDQKPDVIFITSPPDSHMKHATEAARNNCHVFIEKPLAHSLRGIKALCHELETRQLVNMVACNMRFHPGPSQVKKIIDSGMIGQAISGRLVFCSYLPDWRPWQDYRTSYTASKSWGGAILDCIHELDLAVWYFGPGNIAASAHMPAKVIDLETDGLAEMIIAHDEGVMSSVHVSFVQRNYHRTCQITGSEGTIFWDFMKGHVLVYGGDGSLLESYHEPQQWELNRMYIDEIEHFMGAVYRGDKTMNTVADATIAMELALEARSRNDLSPATRSECAPGLELQD